MSENVRKVCEAFFSLKKKVPCAGCPLRDICDVDGVADEAAWTEAMEERAKAFLECVKNDR